MTEICFSHVLLWCIPYGGISVDCYCLAMMSFQLVFLNMWFQSVYLHVVLDILQSSSINKQENGNLFHNCISATVLFLIYTFKVYCWRYIQIEENDIHLSCEWKGWYRFILKETGHGNKYIVYKKIDSDWDLTFISINTGCSFKRISDSTKTVSRPVFPSSNYHSHYLGIWKFFC